MFSPNLAIPPQGTDQKSIWLETARHSFWANPTGRSRGVYPTDQDVETEVHVGPHASLRFMASCVAVILLLNIGITVYGSRSGGSVSSLLVVAQDRCENIKKLDVGLHAVINVLGILALAAVSAFLRALSSPTREELDRAHGKGDWLDIGVPRICNLNHVGVQFGALGEFKLIELLLSCRFRGLSNRGALQRVGCAARDASEGNLQDDGRAINKIQRMQAAASTYAVLDPEDCIDAYSNIYPSKYSDLIMVSSHENATNSQLLWELEDEADNSFLFPPICDFHAIKDDLGNWTTYGYHIQYFLAREVDLDCSLNLDIVIMAIMIVCNTILLALMVFTLAALWATTRRSLAVYGDVISDYLLTEDDYSHGMCVADKSRIGYCWSHRGEAMRLDTSPHRWYQSINRRRLFLLIGIFVAGLALVAIITAATVSGELDMNESGSVTTLAFVSNIPQLFLALVTLVTNAALIEMTQAADYAQFAIKSKRLRVSEAVGSQEGTYLLGMPLKYAIPTITITSLLHWCVSQSIVPVKVTSYPTDSDLYELDLGTADLTFSPLAIIASVIMAGVLVLSTLLLGLKKLKASMPLASSCSLALSAVMHPHEDVVDQTAIYGPVRWGVTEFEEGAEGRVGHLSFTSSRRAMLKIDETTRHK